MQNDEWGIPKNRADKSWGRAVPSISVKPVVLNSPVHVQSLRVQGEVLAVDRCTSVMPSGNNGYREQAAFFPVNIKADNANLLLLPRTVVYNGYSELQVSAPAFNGDYPVTVYLVVGYGSIQYTPTELPSQTGVDHKETIIAGANYLLPADSSVKERRICIPADQPGGLDIIADASVVGAQPGGFLEVGQVEWLTHSGFLRLENNNADSVVITVTNFYWGM